MLARVCCASSTPRSRQSSKALATRTN